MNHEILRITQVISEQHYARLPIMFHVKHFLRHVTQMRTELRIVSQEQLQYINKTEWNRIGIKKGDMVGGMAWLEAWHG